MFLLINYSGASETLQPLQEIKNNIFIPNKKA